jgi:hypothetical protein
MRGKAKPPIPEAIVQLQRQLDQFRSTRPRRTKLPDSVWEAAVELARQHGVYSVAQALRLDYMGLKKKGLANLPTTDERHPGIRRTDHAISSDAGGSTPPDWTSLLRARILVACGAKLADAFFAYVLKHFLAHCG